MTCFSILKSSFLTAMIGFALAVSPALAQTGDHTARNHAGPSEVAEDGKVDAPIVIELFTAADCSACVFADRMLYDATKDKQVIALSCRVNSQTSLLGSSREAKHEANTEGPMDPCVFRQWTYSASSASDVTLKIPVFFFNGKDRARAEDNSQFSDRLNRYHYKSSNDLLEAMLRWKDRNTISIHLPQAAQDERDKINASVWLVRYKDMEVVKMDRGVNKGRVLRFSNIIQDITHVAKWHGDMRIVDIDVPPPQGGKDKGGYVVLVGEMLGLPYKAAGKLADYPTEADLKKDAQR